jgi:N,N'-diacetyllegionaminate synthase
MSKVFIIAEAGVNHNGGLKTAKKLIDAAVRAGADAVKFQSFVPEEMVSAGAAKARYQGSGGDQLEMLKRLALGQEGQRELFAYCGKRKIIFLSSAFDLSSVAFLEKLGLGIFKIPSGEITNLPYLRRVGSLRKKVIMSTGMATMGEIGEALEILVGAGTAKNNITLLHCTTEYPAPISEVNLRAMLTMKEEFGIKVGYSDHTLGIDIALAAVSLGAEVIEKHFTLDKEAEGPDHKASLDPVELTDMVEGIRRIEKALGDGRKVPTDSEKKNMPVVRKSIFAAKPIKNGQVISDDMLIAKRPAIGISPMKWDEIVGAVAAKDFEPGELIK